MNVSRPNRGCWWVCALVLAACSSGEPLNLGDESELTGERLSDYSAEWEGYVEAYHFPSGSDRVRLTLDEQGNGSVTFGEGTPLPQSAELELDTSFHNWEIVEGSPLAVTAAQVSERRLQLSYDVVSPFRGWCEVQTPILRPDVGIDASRYGCLPGYSGQHGSGPDECEMFVPGPGDEELVQVDCTAMFLCLDSRKCVCDAERCSMMQENIVFDGALEDHGERLIGTTTTWGDGVRVTVRLTRIH
jgi:hypothetical protein